MNADPERWWIEGARRDPAAFAPLYDRYFPRVYAYVRGRVARAQDAEDLVAETFLHAVAGLDRFTWRHEASFAAWLFRIAHNLLANFHRQRHNRPPPLSLDAAAGRRSAAAPPDELVVGREQAALLRAALRTLSPRRQEVVALRFFGGLRNREIAAVLDLDERTVAAHLCRGLEDLGRVYRREAHDQREEASCAPNRPT